MAKAKLVSFTPIMRNGEHSSWSRDNKSYYNFNVEFDNGDKGQASSTSTTPKWKIGDDYTYDIATNDKGYTNIRGMKSADFVPGGGYSKNNPNDNKNIAFNVSFDCAIKYAQWKTKSNMPPIPNLRDIVKLAALFNTFLIPHIDDKQTFISACSAMKMAVAVAEGEIIYEGLDTVKKVEDLITVFEFIFKNLTTNGEASLGHNAT